MLRILFTGKQLRVRRRETILNPPKGIKFIPQQKISEMKADHKLNKYTKPGSLSKRILGAIEYGNYIPKKFLKNIDMIYSPGKLVFNRFPHIIELDNLGALVYYKISFLFLLKPFIRLMLESSYCKGIVCISKACETSVNEFFKSKKINKKTTTVYPYIKSEQNNIKQHKKIKLLFISTTFYIKGGKEILNVMEKLNNTNIELTIITKRKDLLEKDYQKITENKQITFVEADLDKQTIKDNYFKTHDILIMPTYRDSFGMVYLEAISFGLAIITTNQYNMPELVIQNKTGFLLNPPFYYFFKQNNIPNTRWYISSLDSYVKKTPFPKIELELMKILQQLVDNPTRITNMRKESLSHFKKTFNETKRKKILKEVLEQ